MTACRGSTLSHWILITCLLSPLLALAVDDLAAQRQALEAQIDELDAAIKAANQAKDKNRVQALREQRSSKQSALRQLKSQQRAASKADEQAQKRAAAERTWATYPAAKQLCSAIEYNRFDLVKQVVESGRYTPAQAKASSEGCFFPLGDAAARGHADITAYLLEKGFPTSAQVPQFGSTITAYDTAAGSSHDRTAILSLLQQRQIPRQAAVTGAVAAPQAMIAGADDFNRDHLQTRHNINAQSMSQGSTLTRAMEKGYIANLRWLIAQGDPVEADMMGRTLLMIAVDSNDPAKVKMLLDAGAEVSRRGVGYSSVLKHADKHLARASKKHKPAASEIIALLQAHGATYSDKER